MWLQDITIYHKENGSYIIYHKKASVRNTSIENRNSTGLSNTDRALIRIFDYEDINISKDDVIVNSSVDDAITKAPLTELRAIYGKDNVYQVVSIDKFIFNDKDLPNHIKIGAI